MPSPVVDPNSHIVKCPACQDVREAGIGECMCDAEAESCIALTQAELDALLVAERERVIQAFGNQGIGIHGPMMDRIRAELRGAK